MWAKFQTTFCPVVMLWGVRMTRTNWMLRSGDLWFLAPSAFIFGLFMLDGNITVTASQPRLMCLWSITVVGHVYNLDAPSEKYGFERIGSHELQNWTLNWQNWKPTWLIFGDGTNGALSACPSCCHDISCSAGSHCITTEAEWGQKPGNHSYI